MLEEREVIALLEDVNRMLVLPERVVKRCARLEEVVASDVSASRVLTVSITVLSLFLTESPLSPLLIKSIDICRVVVFI